MDFYLYIRSDAMILIPALFIIGFLLNQTPHIPGWIHGWIKLSFAVIACLFHYGFNIESVVQGILVSGITVVSRDLTINTVYGLFIKNLGEKQKKNDED